MGELAELFPKMLKDLDNYDLILLSRYVSGGSDDRVFIRVFCSKLINFFCRIVLSKKINDYTSSIFVMKRSVLNETNLLGYGHGDFFVEFLYDVIRKGFRIKKFLTNKKDDDDENSQHRQTYYVFLS